MRNAPASRLPRSAPGVAINRRDLLAAPVPDADMLWRDLHVRDVFRLDGKQRTGMYVWTSSLKESPAGKAWACGLEFDYTNEESSTAGLFGWPKGRTRTECRCLKKHQG